MQSDQIQMVLLRELEGGTTANQSDSVPVPKWAALGQSPELRSS